MANTTDKSILTAAGKALLAQLNAEEKPLIIDKMIFANVPNRPEFPQPDDVVPTDDIVHQEQVEQRGRLSADSVIYSTTLTSDVGPFEFNWTGAYCSEYGVLVTVDHHALTPKTADEPGVAGNTLVRSVVLEYKDIAEITNITVDASSWQYNATDRMKKMDSDVAQSIIDQNGKDWFIEDGFLVTPSGSAYNIKAGAGYVSGNRVSMEFDRSVQVPNKPSFIYIDAHREGTPTGEQVTLFDFVITAEEKDDYIDLSTGKDIPHFVCKIAEVLADGSVSDLRPEGESAGKKWTAKNFVASGVLTHEIMSKSCAHYGLIDTVGFWNEGVGAGRWVRDSRNDDTLKSGTIDVASGFIFDALGAAFRYGERDVYLEAFGCRIDSTESVVDIFNQCNSYALSMGKKIEQHRGELLVDGELHSLVESDLSGATFLMASGARLYVDDERQDYSITLTGDDVVMAEMTEQTSILPLIDPTLLETWKNSFVLIESTELDLWRNNGGQWSAYNKHTVSVMGDDGKLSYTLNHTYTQKTGLKITLFKLPSSRRRFRCPQFEIAANDVGEFVTVRRSFSNITDFAVMPESEAFTEYKSSFGFDKVYDVKLEDPASCGLGLSNTVYYDVYCYKSCHLTIDNADMFTGWKSIDGSYSRDITVKDSVIDSIDMHYGCSGISLLNSTIGGGGMKFGTGARDEAVLIDGCDILHYGNSLVGMRPDYGELKGDFILQNSTVSVKGDNSPGNVIDFLSFFSLNVFTSGGANPSQSRALVLPRKIVVDNVTLRTKAQVYLLATNRSSNDVTTAEKNHVMPQLIRFNNINIEGAAKVMLPWKIAYHDADSRSPTKIELENIHGSPVELDFGHSVYPDQTLFDLYSEKTTVEAVGKKVFGHERSMLKLRHATIHRGLDTVEQGSYYKGYLDYDDLTINIIDSTQMALAGNLKRFTNCLVDASEYRMLTGEKFNFNSRARIAHGNTAIDATYNIAENDPTTGSVAVIPKEGQERNFEHDAEGNLVPTWSMT